MLMEHREIFLEALPFEHEEWKKKKNTGLWLVRGMSRPDFTTVTEAKKEEVPAGHK